MLPYVVQRIFRSFKYTAQILRVDYFGFSVEVIQFCWLLQFLSLVKKNTSYANNFKVQHFKDLVGLNSKLLFKAFSTYNKSLEGKGWPFSRPSFKANINLQSREKASIICALPCTMGRNNLSKNIPIPRANQAEIYCNKYAIEGGDFILS